MEAVLIVGVGIVSVVLFVMFGTNIGKDPTKKTLPQLRLSEQLHLKRLRTMDWTHPKYGQAVEEMNRVSDEIRRRLALMELDTIAAKVDQTSPSATALRSAAAESYEDGWAKAKSMGKNDQQAHDMALVSVLFRRLQQDAPALPANKSTLDVLTMETLPFKVLSSDQGKIAMTEYMVWREHPAEADEALIRNAIQNATETICLKPDGASLIESLRTTPFPWVRLLAVPVSERSRG